MPILVIKVILKTDQYCLYVDVVLEVMRVAWPTDAAAIVHRVVDDLQARELLGQAVAFKLVIAAVEGDPMTPAQAARQLVAAESDPATAEVLAEVALAAYTDLAPINVRTRRIYE